MNSRNNRLYMISLKLRGVRGQGCKLSAPDNTLQCHNRTHHRILRTGVAKSAWQAKATTTNLNNIIHHTMIHDQLEDKESDFRMPSSTHHTRLAHTHQKDARYSQACTQHKSKNICERVYVHGFSSNAFRTCGKSRGSSQAGCSSDRHRPLPSSMHHDHFSRQGWGYASCCKATGALHWSRLQALDQPSAFARYESVNTGI